MKSRIINEPAAFIVESTKNGIAIAPRRSLFTVLPWAVARGRSWKARTEAWGVGRGRTGLGRMD
jgi:hypothetical protein